MSITRANSCMRHASGCDRPDTRARDTASELSARSTPRNAVFETRARASEPGRWLPVPPSRASWAWLPFREPASARCRCSGWRETGRSGARGRLARELVLRRQSGAISLAMASVTARRRASRSGAEVALNSGLSVAHALAIDWTNTRMAVASHRLVRLSAA